MLSSRAPGATGAMLRRVRSADDLQHLLARRADLVAGFVDDRRFAVRLRAERGFARRRFSEHRERRIRRGQNARDLRRLRQIVRTHDADVVQKLGPDARIVLQIEQPHVFGEALHRWPDRRVAGRSGRNAEHPRFFRGELHAQPDRRP